MRSVNVRMPDGTVREVDPTGTLAFNTALSEGFNKMAQLIDPRLYCFAYYNPKQVESDVFAVVFPYVHNNMYGLLYDTSKFCSILASCEELGLKKNQRDRLERCMGDIHCLRTYYTHNNSPVLGIQNSEIERRARRFVGNPKSDGEWEQILSKILLDCILISDLLEEFFKITIPSMTRAQKEDMVQHWLEGAMYPALRHDDTIRKLIVNAYNIACRRDNYNQSNISTPSNSDLGRWIKNHITLCANGVDAKAVDSVLVEYLDIFDGLQRLKDYYTAYLDYLKYERLNDYLDHSEDDRNKTHSLFPLDYYSKVLSRLQATPLRIGVSKRP